MEDVTGIGLANRIIQKSKERHLAPSTVCIDAGSRKSRVSDLKSGRIATIRADTLYKIAKQLLCSCDWLVSGEEFGRGDTYSFEEQKLIQCWRACTDEERENIAFALRSYGMPMPEPKLQIEQEGTAV